VGVKIDLTGTTVGALLVLNEIDGFPSTHDWGKGRFAKRSKGRQGGPRWRCKCKCGAVVLKTSAQLKPPNCLSCKDCKEVSNRKRPYEYLYSGVLRRRKDGIPVELSYDEFVTFTQCENCHYCMAKLVWYPYSTKKESRSTGYNLDRKNPKLGYTVTNCVPCCARCNLSKGDRFSYEEWIKIGSLIKSFSAEVSL